MGNVVTEEQAIIHAQYLDLVYSQSDTLYDLIPNAPHPSNDPTRPAPEPVLFQTPKLLPLLLKPLR
jgi:hypothetical protein